MSLRTKIETHYAVRAEVDLERMEQAYYAAMLWSSTGIDDKNLDADHDVDDISDELAKSSEADCKKFVEICEKANIDLSKYAAEDLGHDLWLTRAGHGAGFWDGDYDDDGDALTEIVEKNFKNLDPYAGDDGKIYV